MITPLRAIRGRESHLRRTNPGTPMKRLVLLLLVLLPLSLRAQEAPDSTRRFVLGPGDVVRVRIWREKDLDGEFQIDESGRLTLPLLGPVTVTNMPWPTLRDSLLALYRHDLKAPSIALTPLRRVYVLGEVTKPGQYLADPTISLAGIVAMAGGASPQGDVHKLRVVRGGHVLLSSRAIEQELLTAIQSDDQIFVDQRSWFDRNSTFVASAAISLASVIVALLRR
jgi:protein involved in polysaccharide export with SLBB domain